MKNIIPAEKVIPPWQNHDLIEIETRCLFKAAKIKFLNIGNDKVPSQSSPEFKIASAIGNLKLRLVICVKACGSNENWS